MRTDEMTSKLNELVYFGSSFDCEPLGLPLERIRLELAE